MSGLLTNLLSFGAREGLTPKENFLTVALASALERSERARSALAEAVLQRNVDGAEIRVSRWVPLSKGEDDAAVFPDMVLDVDNSERVDSWTHRIIFEHKWGSPASSSQLTKYRAGAERTYQNVQVVLLTAQAGDAAEAEVAGCRMLLWEQVYEVLRTANVGERTPALEELLIFMQEQGLAPADPVTPARLRAYEFSRCVPSACVNLLGQVHKRAWNFLPDALRVRRRFSSDPPEQARAGTYFPLLENADFPAIFAGIVFDAAHYGIRVNEHQASRPPHLAVLIEGLDNRSDRLMRETVERLDGRDLNASVYSFDQISDKSRNVAILRPLTSVLIGAGPASSDQQNAILETFDLWCHPVLSAQWLGALRECYA